MQNLATINKSDFTITEDGEAFISQRRASELIGMPRRTLGDWIHKNSATLNLNKFNQLDPKSFQKAVISASNRGIVQAAELEEKLMEAGSKAFIYHEAGYELSATKVPTQLEAAKQQLKIAAEIVEVIEKNILLGEQVNTLEVDHDKSGDYISVKRMRDLYPDKNISNKGLIGASKELDLSPTSYDGIYDAHCPALYHKDVWFMVYGINI